MLRTLEQPVGQAKTPDELEQTVSASLESLVSGWRAGGWPCEVLDAERASVHEKLLYAVAVSTLLESSRGWSRSVDPSLPSEETKPILVRKMRSHAHYEWFLANLQALLPYVQSEAPGPEASYETAWQWAFVVSTLLEQHAELQEKARAAAADEDKEEEEEEEEEADGEEEEGGGDAAAQKIQKMVLLVKDDFSYFGPIAAIWTARTEGTIVGNSIKSVGRQKERLSAAQEWLKSRVKRVTELLGVGGIFVALDRAAKKSRLAEIGIRLGGTLVVVVGVVAFVAFTLWRISRSPFRFVGRFAKDILQDLDIEFPAGE